MQNNQSYDWTWWVLLQSIPSLSPRRILKLRDAFGGDLEAVWRAPRKRLVTFLGEQMAERICAARERPDAAAILRRIAESGQTVICYADVRYPELLRETDAPPVVLYVEGELTAADDLAIAVIGAREATPYGRDVAHMIASQLAAGGVTVVSGLARGIDAVAHEAALAAGGRTIAVLAGGLDQIYPAAHRGLARRICTQGALITEYPPGTRALPGYFPARNRIMAGLSAGVVIAEAQLKSGSLITANFALHYNREVFAVPGGILSPSSAGCHELIRQGATLVTSATDILHQLEFDRAVPVTFRKDPDVAATSAEQGLLSLLATEPRHIDDLALDANQPIHEVATLLMMLELKGQVRNTGAQCYALIR